MKAPTMKLLRSSLALCATVLLSAVDIPEEATITMGTGAVTSGFILVETLDELKYRMGDASTGAETTQPRAKVASVEYGLITDMDYSKGTGLMSRGEFEKAAQSFLLAIEKTPFVRVRELAHLKAAEALRQAKQVDESLKILSALETKAPRTILLPRAYDLKARLLVEKGDLANADGVLAKLMAMNPILGAVLKADLMRGAKKPAEAAEALRTIWGKVIKAGDAPLDAEAPTFASVGFQLGADLVAAGDSAAASDVYTSLCYSSIAKGAQAKAHRQLADLLAKTKAPDQLRLAVDHALMAAAMSGAEKDSAKKIVLQVLTEFDKDAALKDEATEYRQYLNSL